MKRNSFDTYDVISSTITNSETGDNFFENTLLYFGVPELRYSLYIYG